MKLGDLIIVRTGKLDANAENINGQYPFFTCSKQISWINTYAFDCECVLIAGNGELYAKYYNGKFNAYQRTYVIESNNKNKLDVKFLFYFFSWYIEVLRHQSIGGVIKYIKLTNLVDVDIKLPTLERQKQIVNILENLQNCLSNKKKEVNNLDDLIKSRFIEMFGNIEIENYITFEEICLKITDGTHQPPKFTSNGIPFLLVSNITTNEITYSTTKFINEVTYKELIKRTPIEIGDILLSTVGSYGHPAIVKKSDRFCFQRHIAYLKPNKNLINSVYLHAAILTDDLQEQIEKSVNGVAQKTLNLSEIKKLKLPLPSIERQNQFAEFVKLIDKSKFVYHSKNFLWLIFTLLSSTMAYSNVVSIFACPNRC